MEWDQETGTFRLHSGRSLATYLGPLGLQPDLMDDFSFTDAERQEIAAYMADRWQKWARQEPS